MARVGGEEREQTSSGHMTQSSPKRAKKVDVRITNPKDSSKGVVNELVDWFSCYVDKYQSMKTSKPLNTSLLIAF